MFGTNMYKKTDMKPQKNELIESVSEFVAITVSDYISNHIHSLSDRGFEIEDLLEFARTVASIQLSNFLEETSNKVYEKLEERNNLLYNLSANVG